MKKIVYIILTLFIAPGLWAQSPQKMNYQTVIRNNDNAMIANASVGIQVSIHQGSAEGPVVYSETHSTATNANGLVNIEIGTGNKSWWKPNFKDIDWTKGPYFIKTETDPNGGSAYTLTGLSQIASIPYAQHAESAETLVNPLIEEDPVFETSVSQNINQSDFSVWNNKQNKLIAGKGIIISGNEISLNPAVLEGEKTGGIAQFYKNDKNIETDPDVVLFTDFENPNWGLNWNTSGHPVVTSNEKEKFIPFDGNALQVTVPEGKNSGLSITYKFKQKTGSEPEEIYFRYYLRIGDGWSPSFGGKFPGIAGTYDRGGWGGRPSDGYNGWSARGLYERTTNGKTPIGNYVYHADMRGQWGSHWVWNNENRGYLEKNRWYCVEMYVKLNTPELNDGILRGWIDGLPAYEKTDLSYRKTSDLKIETVWLNVYHGGSDVAPSDQVLFIDNIVIAKKYIGPRK